MQESRGGPSRRGDPLPIAGRAARRARSELSVSDDAPTEPARSSAPTVPPTEPEAWALLLSVDGLGPAGLGALLAAYGSALAILAAAALRGAAPRLSRIASEGRRAGPDRDVGANLVEAVADLSGRLAV